MQTQAQYRLDLTPKQAALLWQCAVSGKARVTKRQIERLDTYDSQITADALREAADHIEFLANLSKELAVYCRENGIEVEFGRTS